MRNTKTIGFVRSIEAIGSTKKEHNDLRFCVEHRGMEGALPTEEWKEHRRRGRGVPPRARNGRSTAKDMEWKEYRLG
jgi:hypothetical protein